MAVAFYMDVHIPRPIVEGLRRRGVSVLTSQEDRSTAWSDEKLLTRASELGHVLVSQDEDLLAIAQAWQAERRSFAGLIYAHQLNATIGDLVRDLELIAECGLPADHLNQVIFLPL